MKKQMLFLIIFVFVLTACSNTSASVAEPTNQILPTATITPSPTIAPSPTPDPLLFKDDFNSSIDPGWKWVKENNCRFRECCIEEFVGSYNS
jgi:hypothetical protein